MIPLRRAAQPPVSRRRPGIWADSIATCSIALFGARPWGTIHRSVTGAPARHPAAPEGVVSSVPPAKFFVNRGIVSSRTDLLNVLRPLEKQTVAYRYYRGHELVQHGMGWVERIVAEEPETSTFFTPLSICLNVDSFEHLEFETRPDQLLTYRLVQGDEAVVIDFAPSGDAVASPLEPRQLEFDTSGYVQMELHGPDATGDE